MRMIPAGVLSIVSESSGTALNSPSSFRNLDSRWAAQEVCLGGMKNGSITNTYPRATIAKTSARPPDFPFFEFFFFLFKIWYC